MPSVSSALAFDMGHVKKTLPINGPQEPCGLLMPSTARDGGDEVPADFISSASQEAPSTLVTIRPKKEQPSPLTSWSLGISQTGMCEGDPSSHHLPYQQISQGYGDNFGASNFAPADDMRHPPSGQSLNTISSFSSNDYLREPNWFLTKYESADPESSFDTEQQVLGSSCSSATFPEYPNQNFYGATSDSRQKYVFQSGQYSQNLVGNAWNS